jgi:hypothetical protein
MHINLLSKVKKCVFLGYNSNYKGYWCFDPQTNRVYISGHVVFDELNFPAQDTLTTTGITPPLQQNSPQFLESTRSGTVSNTLSPIQATLPNFSIDLLDSDNHLRPSQLTLPHQINTTPIPDHLSTYSNLESSSVSDNPNQQPTPTSTLTPSSYIITRSQTNSSKPKHFPDYHLYHSTHKIIWKL